ncbi:diacylglycerol kinase family protein [Tsuneonella sp. HG222]
MGNKPTVWLICNEASGSNDEAVVGDLCDRLAPDRVFAVPRDELPSKDMLAVDGPDVLAIFTGDGTANAALKLAEGFGGKILVLPGGTTNLLSRSLHGEGSTVDAILAGFEQGTLCEVSRKVIQTSQGFAHSEVLAGPGAAWSDVRETLREFDVAGIARTAGEAIQQTTDGPAVVVAEPKIGSIEGYPALLLTATGEKMQVDGYRAEDVGEVLQQGLALLMRDFRGGPHDELGLHSRVLLHSEAPINLMIDGERATGQQEESIALRTADLVFLALCGAAES